MEANSGFSRHASAVLFCVFCALGTLTQQAHGASVGVPAEGKALIVFVRAESDQSIANYRRGVLFEIKNETSNPEAIATMASKTIVAYQANPGKHLFMIWGESADFMTADVTPGATYYVLVNA